MNKAQAAAIASVICRSIDYYHARATSEKEAQCVHAGSPEASAIITGLKESEGRVAEALELIPDED